MFTAEALFLFLFFSSPSSESRSAWNIHWEHWLPYIQVFQDWCRIIHKTRYISRVLWVPIQTASFNMGGEISRYFITSAKKLLLWNVLCWVLGHGPMLQNFYTRFKFLFIYIFDNSQVYSFCLSRFIYFYLNCSHFLFSIIVVSLNLVLYIDWCWVGFVRIVCDCWLCLFIYLYHGAAYLARSFL